MKKIRAVLAAALMVLTLSACGADSQHTKIQNREITGENPSSFSGDELPVESVTWLDAIKYCNQRSEKEGLTPAYAVNGQVVTGEKHIDLARAAEILKETFGIERLGVVGGPAINTAFLDAGLLDEVIILIGAGIDGRASFPPVFNRNDNGKKEPTPLELVDVKKYSSGAVFIRYKTK